ncbi:MAG: hypothetical protein J6A05_11200 [Oscillospiraceae bacterium]|nr:hypothetical protein [Oscillospiraceae bacterium]
MNCPVCGKEMETGFCRMYDTRGGKLAWLPYEFCKRSTHFLLTKDRVRKNGGVITSVHSTIFDNEEQISWCCKDCGKIVIDIKK